MSSRSSLAIFGTEFDAIDDEQRDAISKKPLAVQDQVATDEKGRRRFHGAFTGGFSAGYFNTVGTKHGWVPQTFKSTRTDRAEKTKQNAEDFMDEEDLGEFGIASRRIRTAVDFVDQLALPGDKRRLAWERDTSKLSAEASRLADLIRPVSDSIGMRLLKKMGWRAGQGIGPKMSKAAIGRQNNDERRARGETEEQIETVVSEMGEMAPGFQFAPEDVDPYYFTAKTDDHGLGYVGLQSSGVLEQKNYGKKSSTLKTNNKAKGITGQAFGVGAFEDEDADIYTTDDLSQYDYSINESGSSYQEKKVDVLGADFIEAKKVLHSRKFYPAPKLPADFRPHHKPTTIKLTHMPSTIGSRMTPIERARYLGEGTASVMSLVRDEDRVRLERTVRSRWDQTETMTSNRQQPQTSSTSVPTTPLPFDDQPMKQRRYKEYVKYLRRGLNMPQPIDLTEWEWEREMIEFQSELSPELRAVLPEVKARLLPLARPEVSASFAHLLKSKFTSGATLNDNDAEKAIVKKDDDKVQAVRMKMFGAMTRERYEWHPNRQLSKRFNIPEPYPDSSIDGVPQFQRETKKESIYDMSILPTTALELANRQVVENLAGVPTCDVKEEDTTADVEQQRPPIDLFQAIFASDQESSNESSDDDDDDGGGENEKSQSINVTMNPTTSTNVDGAPVESLPTVMELIALDEPQTSAIKVEVQEEEYGPAVPARTDSPTLPSYSVIARHRSKHHRSDKKKKKSKKSKKDKKKQSEDDRDHHHHHRKKKVRQKSNSDNDSIILLS